MNLPVSNGATHPEGDVGAAYLSLARGRLPGEDNLVASTPSPITRCIFPCRSGRRRSHSPGAVSHSPRASVWIGVALRP
jgi:hypothetical protein